MDTGTDSEVLPEQELEQSASAIDSFIKKIHDRPIAGKYLLTEKLGEGRFGSVWLGKAFQPVVNTAHL
jgi:hypothetical protein